MASKKSMKQILLTRIQKTRVTEEKIVSVVFSMAPWLTPLITAWLVYDSTIAHLHWSEGRALISAVIIETSGISSTNLVLKLYKMQAEKKLILLALAMVGVYAVTIMALTFLLDTRPDLAVYAPLLFVPLSLSSSATVALRTYATVAKKQQRATRKAVTPAQPLRKGYTVATVAQPESETEQDSKASARERLRSILIENPEACWKTSDELADMVGCTGANIRKIAHRNGQGWQPRPEKRS